MLSKSWSQLKENFSTLIGLNTYVIAILIILNTVINIDNLVLKYVIVNTAIAIPLFFTHKACLQISSSNTKTNFKDLFLKNTIKDIAEMSLVYFIISIISIFTTAIITIITAVLMVPFFSSLNACDVGPIHLPILLSAVFLFPVFIYLKLAFIPLCILDNSFKELTLSKRILLGFKINKWNLKEMINHSLLLILLIVGGLLFFGVGIVINIALINLMLSNSYIKARDTYIKTSTTNLDD